MSVVVHDNLEKKPTRKHIAERQRRARINLLLEQLETLISSGDNGSTPVKLEKAEVLERTVDYVKRTKDGQMDTASTYVYGYMNCIQSIDQYLKDSRIQPTVRDSIQSYLLSNITTDAQTVPRSPEINNNNQSMSSTTHDKNGRDIGTCETNMVVSNKLLCGASMKGSQCNDDNQVNFHDTGNNASVWRPW